MPGTGTCPRQAGPLEARPSAGHLEGFAERSRDLYDPATMWQAYVRFRSGSTTRADVAETEDDARKALEDAMNQLKSNGIGTVGPSLVVTKDDLEFIKLEQKQQDR